MAFSDMQTTIADELDRSDLTTEISREILNAVTFYQHKSLWFNEATMTSITTVAGQRYYALPTNFVSVTDVLSTIGNFTYRLRARTEQYIDQIDWGNNFWSSYPTDFSVWNGQIRLFPPPMVGLPVQVKGQVLLAALSTTAPTNTYAVNTAFSSGNTVADSNGNIQTAQNNGTSGATVPVWNTQYLQNTTDNTITWQLTAAPTNAWMIQAEELIRTRATKMLYMRYLHDSQMAQAYQQIEAENLMNLNEKNVGKTSQGWVRPHF